MTEVTVLKCWACLSEYDLRDISFCSHTDPSAVCPYCLQCLCKAPEPYRQAFFEKCPASLLRRHQDQEQRAILKIGEILIHAGKISQAHLLAAIEKQKTLNQRIGQILIMMNLLTQEELALFLLEQRNIGKINLEGFELDFNLVERIGARFCLSYRIAPIELSRLNKQYVFRFAISSRQDYLKMRQNPHLKNIILIPCEAEPHELQRLLSEISKRKSLWLK